MPKKGQVRFVKNVTKNNQKIISEPYAYFQNMAQTALKFQNNRHKTVGGVAHTMYLLSNHCDSETCGRSDRNNQRIISKPQASFQTMTKTSVNFKRNGIKL